MRIVIFSPRIWQFSSKYCNSHFNSRGESCNSRYHNCIAYFAVLPVEFISFHVRDQGSRVTVFFCPSLKSCLLCWAHPRPLSPLEEPGGTQIKTGKKFNWNTSLIKSPHSQAPVSPSSAMTFKRVMSAKAKHQSSSGVDVLVEILHLGKVEIYQWNSQDTMGT